MAHSPAANLLLISFDQWRGDWGDPLQPVVNLPALERLGQQGLTARRCYTSSPHCVPARFSWLTGMAPSQLGVTRNVEASLPPDAPSLVRKLRDQGWHTALVGKTHWSSHAKTADLRDGLPLLQELGFNTAIEVPGPRGLRRMHCALSDAWQRAGLLDQQRTDLNSRYGAGRTPAAWAVRPTVLPAELYPDIWIAERGLELLAAMPTQQPWLLWVSFVGPHEPFDTPRPWHGKSDAAALPAPTKQPTWIRALPEHCELRRTAASWAGLLTAEAIAACRADYADHLQLLDEQLAKLLAALAQRIDGPQTAVAVCADHGELLGDAGLLYKGAFLEGAIRVPWVYRAPAASNRHDQQQPQQLNQPLPLTGLLQQTLSNLGRGGGITALMDWAHQQRSAVVEFGSERLILQGKRKLATDQKGWPLWAIHLGRDPLEQCNVITAQPKRWRISPGWRKLRQEARMEARRRSAKNWLWRQLGPHG